MTGKAKGKRKLRLPAGFLPSHRGSFRQIPTPGICRRCERENSPIRSQLGLCVTCYVDVKSCGELAHYPYPWTYERVLALGPPDRSLLWRRMSVMLVRMIGATTSSDWLGGVAVNSVQPPSVEHIVAAVRCVGYLSWVFARREIGTEAELDDVKAAGYLASVRALATATATSHEISELPPEE